MEPPSSHTINYTVLNSGYTHETGRDWSIHVAARPAELEQLAQDGYLLREGLCAGAMLEQLRTALVPGSHRWLDRDAPSGYEPMPGERVFRLRAGDAILMHGNLWHRALPTVSARRRMLILSYTPSWLRHSPHHGPRPEDGLTTAFLENADLEGRMLLGEGGYS